MPKNNKKSKANQQKKGPGKKRVMVALNRAKTAGNKQLSAAALGLTPCSAKYLIACTNPWHAGAMGACVPSKPARPTQKVCTVTRFDAVIGSGGLGYVLISPTLGNNTTLARYTLATFAGTTNLTGSTGVVGVTTATAPSPYTYAQLTDSGSAGAIPAIEGRMVSCGVSAQYIGTELNRGGLVYCFVDPGHESLENITLQTLASRLECSVERTMEGKCWINTSAISSTESEFPEIAQAASVADAGLLGVYPYSQGNPIDTFTVTNGAPIMCIAFTGTVGNSYHIEIIQHMEYIGVLTEGKTTPNSLDEQGFGRVLEVVNKLPSLKTSHPKKSIGALALMALKDVVKEHGPAMIEAGGKMALAALMV